MSWFYKFCLGKTDESMQPYKVQTSHGKIRRIGIVASSMKDLLKKACQKLVVRSTYYRPSLGLTHGMTKRQTTTNYRKSPQTTANHHKTPEKNQNHHTSPQTTTNHHHNLGHTVGSETIYDAGKPPQTTANHCKPPPEFGLMVIRVLVKSNYFV